MVCPLVLITKMGKSEDEIEKYEAGLVPKVILQLSSVPSSAG
jgi:hypothetical protein